MTVSKTSITLYLAFSCKDHLKNTELPERFKARGLKKVEERLMYDKMDTTARQQYDQYLKDVKISKSMIDTAKLEGKLEGKIEIILSSYDDGLDITRIARITKLSEAEVVRILKGDIFLQL